MFRFHFALLTKIYCRKTQFIPPSSPERPCAEENQLAMNLCLIDKSAVTKFYFLTSIVDCNILKEG